MLVVLLGKYLYHNVVIFSTFKTNCQYIDWFCNIATFLGVSLRKYAPYFYGALIS